MATTIAMDLTEMRTFVRNHLDVDSTELPDSLLDRFIIDGADRIERASVALGGRWSFREVTYGFTVAGGTASYDLDTYAGLNGGALAPLAFLDEVRGPTWSLLPEDHRAMRARNSRTSPATGTPRWFTVWGRKLYLWPTPAASGDYEASGTRKGKDWVATNAAPDFPDEFHELIAGWALTRAYIQQDDIELATIYREEWAQTVKERAVPYIVGNQAQPFALNGAAGNTRVTSNPSNLVYPFLH